MLFTRQNLTSSSALWSLFLLTLVITALFPIAASLWDLAYVDVLSSPARAREVIEGFSAQQRTAHAWVTATVDAALVLALTDLTDLLVCKAFLTPLKMGLFWVAHAGGRVPR